MAAIRLLPSLNEWFFTTRCRKFCDYRLTFQFLPQCIIDMFCYCLVISTIKLSYLLSIKPHGIFLQLHFKLGITIFRLIKYDR